MVRVEPFHQWARWYAKRSVDDRMVQRRQETASSCLDKPARRRDQVADGLVIVQDERKTDRC